MILAGRLGYIFSNKRVKILKNSKSLKHWLKKRGLYIKVLRSDRSGEFSSNEFLEFCRFHGIKKQFATRYTPQQTGVAERKNKTIMEMARSMLKAKNLSNVFWA